MIGLLLNNTPLYVENSPLNRPQLPIAAYILWCDIKAVYPIFLQTWKNMWEMWKTRIRQNKTWIKSMLYSVKLP